MYLDARSTPVPNPDPTGGLYIKDRSGAVVQAAIPPDHIAFQMGQAMAIQSGGLLHATPHYVRAARPRLARGVSRNTFAVFLQPDVSFEMRPPRALLGSGSSAAATAAGATAAGGGGGGGGGGLVVGSSPSKLTAQEAWGWRPGMSFGAFAAAVMSAYYEKARVGASGEEGDQDREQGVGAGGMGAAS